MQYHIAAFIGLGCTSSRHDWYKATARGLVWSTNYKINLNNLANVPLTEIYPDGAIFPEDGNYVPPARLLDYYTGSTGKKVFRYKNLLKHLRIILQAGKLYEKKNWNSLGCFGNNMSFYMLFFCCFLSVLSQKTMPGI